MVRFFEQRGAAGRRAGGRALALLLAFGCLIAGCRSGASQSGTTDVTTQPQAEIRASAGGLLFREVVVRGESRRYAVLIPRGYQPGTPMPAIVFLNGSGECGTDGSKQAVVGLGSAALLSPEKWPFIIIFPQKPNNREQWHQYEDLVMATLDATRREFSVDEARVYLTGLSQGGAGTWAIGAKRPEVFAAIAPVCGYGEPARLGAALRDMPIWAFHGEKDDIVKPEQTRNIVAAIEAAGGKPRVTYFPDANHNSWDPAYRSGELGAWFLQHRKGR